MQTHVARLLTALVVLLGSFAGGVLSPAQAVDTVAVTGSVIDSVSGEGLDGAEVQATNETDSPPAVTSGVDGSYSLTLAPGTYDFYVDAAGYEPGFLTYDVTADSTTIPVIELVPAAPGIFVYVENASWAGPAANASIELRRVSDGSSTEIVTDNNGRVMFDQVHPGEYTVRVLPTGDYLGTKPEPVDYQGGASDVFLSVEADLSCEPESVNTGLTNMGFESGLDGWTLGFQAESVQAIDADAFTSPWEGLKMARLGLSQPSESEEQPPGPNTLCQDFVVDQAQETFAFNVFTYDYTGYDEFQFDVVVTAPSTGETLAAYRQEAWGDGSDTSLKTSGWRGVELDLAGHVGETVRLTFRSGGTSDSAFAFWAYLDSADTLPPVVETPASDIETTTGSVTNDPVTGLVTVAMPSGEPSDVTLKVPAQCQVEGTTPSSVSVFLNSSEYPAAPAGAGQYTVTIPAAEVVSGTLSVQVTCGGETTLVYPLGKIVLYDPSGIVSDAVTGSPVVGAEVTLYKVPGWVPQWEAGPYPTDSCQSNLSKEDGAPWSQPAPTELGQKVNPASPEISPNVNPFVTNSSGYYGWDVAEGCWYVVVAAEGYQTLTSPVVGVPPEVTDLDLALEPVMPPNTGNPTPPPSTGNPTPPPGETPEPAPIENIGKPVISGEPKVGSTLSTTSGAWNTAELSYSYQWLRNGVRIARATAATYRVRPADAAKSISVRVTASKSGHLDAAMASDSVKVAKIAPRVRLKVLKKKFLAGTKAKVVVRVRAVGGPPPGKVVLKAGKKRLGVAVLGSGRAKIVSKRSRKLDPGRYKLVAVYKGSAVHARSKSGPVRVRVLR